MVAERAGASIGTVYRYFPDRIAVLQSVSARSLNQFSTKIQATLNNPKHATWQNAVDAVVTDLVDAFKHVPGFRSLRFGDVVDIRPAVSERTGNGILAAQVAGALSSRFGLAGGAELTFRLEAAIDLADALLARAFLYDKKGDNRFIAEARTVVRSYLGAYYADPSTAP